MLIYDTIQLQITVSNFCFRTLGRQSGDPRDGVNAGTGGGHGGLVPCGAGLGARQ